MNGLMFLHIELQIVQVMDKNVINATHQTMQMNQLANIFSDERIRND